MDALKNFFGKELISRIGTLEASLTEAKTSLTIELEKSTGFTTQVSQLTTERDALKAQLGELQALADSAKVAVEAALKDAKEQVDTAHSSVAAKIEERATDLAIEKIAGAGVPVIETVEVSTTEELKTKEQVIQAIGKVEDPLERAQLQHKYRALLFPGEAK
jgi:vacuolar-type H+-ATPase subunit D/Vma8